MKQGIDVNALPEFQPPPELWVRIASAERARRHRRRSAFASAAAAVVVVLVALAAWPLRDPPAPVVAAGEVESRRLEAEWLRVAGGSTPSSTTRLRAIDAALQAAYDRGAAADEVEPLWRQRNDALRGLIASLQQDAVAGVIRI